MSVTNFAKYAICQPEVARQLAAGLQALPCKAAHKVGEAHSANTHALTQSQTILVMMFVMACGSCVVCKSEVARQLAAGLQALPCETAHKVGERHNAKTWA